MGQAPLTGTGCPFPYANTSMTPPCSQLCSEVLGAKYLALLIPCLIVSSVGLVVLIWKMMRLYQRYRLDRKKGGRNLRLSAVRKSFTFWFFICWFVLLFIITSVDMRGYAGIMDPIAYTILNELAAASLICAGLTLVDFWIACASPTGESGIPYRYQIIASVYLNFVGLTAAGLIDVDHFNIYDGTKGILACIMIAIWALLAYEPTRNIKRTLLQLYDQNVEGFTSNNVAIKNRQHKIVSELERKFVFFFWLACFGSVVYFTFGMIAFRSNDPVFGYRWSLPCEIGPVSIIFKCAEMVACIAAFAFFSVPRGSGMGSDVSSNDKKNGAHTILAVSSSPNFSKG